MQIVQKIIAKSAEEAFHKILNALNDYGLESAPRGYRIKEILDCNIVITNPRDRFISCPERRTSLAYAFGELSWYMDKRNDLETMKYYSKFMESMSDDGETLNSAYGYRIFGKHGMIPFDQWENVKRLLKQDPDSRQAVIHLHTPNNRPTKDEVCTMNLQFLVRENKLSLITTMRSNDVVLGFTYDVFAFTSMLELMADELGLEVGEYYHNAGSMHIYLDDYYGKGNDCLNHLLEKHTYSPLGEMPDLKTKSMDSIIKLEKSYRRFVTSCQLQTLAEDWVREDINCFENRLKNCDIANEDNIVILARAAFLMKAISKLGNSVEFYQGMVLDLLGLYEHETSNSMLIDSSRFTKGGKKIIIDGVDKSGKTTLIKEIKSKLENEGRKPYIRHYSKAGRFFTYFLDYSHHLLSTVDEIFDRSFISELVYGAVIRNEIKLDEIGTSLLIQMMKEQNVEVILIIPKDVQALKERMLGSEDESLIPYIEKINGAYKQIHELLLKNDVDVKVLEDGCSEGGK